MIRVFSIYPLVILKVAFILPPLFIVPVPTEIRLASTPLLIRNRLMAFPLCCIKPLIALVGYFGIFSPNHVFSFYVPNMCAKI